MCDFVEELGIEGPLTIVTFRNWENCPVVIAELVASLVTQDNPVWSEPVQLTETVVRLCHLNGVDSLSRAQEEPCAGEVWLVSSGNT